MKFLNKAFFDDNGDIDGFILTDYTEDSRPKIIGYSYNDVMQSINPDDCVGFKLDDNGVLYSDSFDCYPSDKSELDYIMNDVNECTHRTSDITDIMLFGLRNKCGIMRDYNPSKSAEEHYIMLIKNFKVSMSTFNIYSKYKMPDDTYRTFSLFDTETGEGNDFYLVVDKTIEIPKNITHMLTQVCDNFNINGLDCTVFKSTAILEPYANLGGAFINYCSCNTEYYLHGEKVINSYHKQFGDYSKADKLSKMVKDVKPPKSKQSCIVIEHITRGKYKYNNVIELLEDEDALRKLITNDYASRIAYNFLYDLNENVDVYSKEGSPDPISCACMNMLDKCHNKLLHFSLELLSIRYSIYHNIINGGLFLLPMIVKGGGVYGDSAIKRTTW